MERLQKIIASAGLASRRQAEILITTGKVKVNGKTVDTLGSQADPSTDKITVEGKVLPTPESVVYLLYKPKGYVSTLTAQGNQRLITELVPAVPRVYPVGRLDKESEGLILLTNDGNLSARLTHPRYNHQKTYLVQVRTEGTRRPTPQWISERLVAGVKLGDGDAKADSVNVKQLANGEFTLIITVHEGRKHLVRRMCATLDLDVRFLKRTHFATLSLGSLKPGAWRRLRPSELSHLRVS